MGDLRHTIWFVQPSRRLGQKAIGADTDIAAHIAANLIAQALLYLPPYVEQLPLPQLRRALSKINHAFVDTFHPHVWRILLENRHEFAVDIAVLRRVALQRHEGRAEQASRPELRPYPNPLLLCFVAGSDDGRVFGRAINDSHWPTSE